MELFIIIGALVAFGIFVLVRFLKNCDKAQDGAYYTYCIDGSSLTSLMERCVYREHGIQIY